MANLIFGNFTFPIAPESCLLSFHRDYDVSATQNGSWTSSAGVRLARRMECRGSFCGPQAHSQFSTLATLFMNGTKQTLTHYKWSPFPAFIAELEVLEEAQKNLLQYRILFVELPGAS